MAIENTASQTAYDCDGVSTAFPTGWPVLDADSVTVIQEDIASGDYATLVRGTHYTVTLGETNPVTSQPGNGVVLAIGAAPAVGLRWHLLRKTVAVQPVVLQTAGQVPSKRLESQADRMAVVAQETQRVVEQAVRVPPHEQGNMTLPVSVQRRGRLMAFGEDGQPMVPAFTTGQVAAMLDSMPLQLLAGSVHEFVSDGITTIWPLPAEWGLIYAVVSLSVNIGGVGGQTGAYSLTDGAAHTYPGRTVIVFPQPLPVHVRVEIRVPPVAAGQAVNDDTHILARRTLVPRRLRDWFSARGLPVIGFVTEGVTDITSALNAAATEAKANGIRTLLLPAGNWSLTGSIDLTFDGAGDTGTLSLVGVGKRETWIYTRLTEPFPALDCTGNTHATLQDFTIQHAVDCSSTCTILGAKPQGGGGRGQQLQIINIDIQRQWNSPNSAPCVIVANADLPLIQRCEMYGRRGIWWGLIDTSLLTSKFQTLSAMLDFTLGRIRDCIINTSDAQIELEAGSGFETVISGGYLSVIGNSTPALGGAKAQIHIYGPGRLIIASLRTENQTAGEVQLDGVIAFHSNSTASTINLRCGNDDPLVWVAPSASVGGLELTGFCDYNAPAIFKSAGGVIADARVNTNRDTWLIGVLSADLRNVQVRQQWTTPAGSQAAPGLRIGTVNAGFYVASRADQLAGSTALGVVLDGIAGLEFFRQGTAGFAISPGVATSATANGRSMRVSGGGGGYTSGNTGSVGLSTLSPVDGNSGGINISTASAVGSNKSGGAFTVSLGASTGSANGPALTLKAGKNDTAGSFGGNAIIGAGDSAGGYPGSVYLDSGVGAAQPGVAVVALRNRALGPIQFQTGGANRWAIDGNGSYASALRPEASGVYDVATADLRVRDIYLTNSPNVSSDIRTKLDVQVISDAQAADFIGALRPCLYRLAHAGQRVVKWEIRQETVERVDPDTGNHIVETVDVQVPIEVPHAGTRLHAGFIAQEVREVLSAVFPGLDLALWGLGDARDPQSRQHLRYEQFIAPMAGAIRHLISRIEALEASHGQ